MFGRRFKKLENEISVMRVHIAALRNICYENNLYGTTMIFENHSPHPDPVYANKGDSGFDLRAWIKEDDKEIRINENGERCIVVEPNERRLVHTGIKVEVPKHTEIQIRPRSGCALKRGLSIANSPGTIDEGYTGELCLIALNTSNEPIVITDGERIAQGVVCPVLNSYWVDMKKVDSIAKETERGEGGFGHTGTK